MADNATASQHRQDLLGFLEELNDFLAGNSPTMPDDAPETLRYWVVIAITEYEINSNSDMLHALERFMLNHAGRFPDRMSGIIDSLNRVLATALRELVPPQFVDRLKLDSTEREVLEYIAKQGPVMTQQIARAHRLDEGEVHAVATRLHRSGYVTGRTEHPDDPGYTWSITNRGRRALQLLYR